MAIASTRMTLRQLQIFVAVAARGSTTGASGDLALSQSATSAALIELEGVLGTPLFDRVGRRLSLNDAGRTLLPQARQLLESAQALEERFVAWDVSASFSLQIAASTTIGNYILPASMASFLRTRTEGRIELRIGNTEEVARAVASFDADLGFIEGPCHEPRVQAVPWRTDELVIVAAPSHPIVREAARGRVNVAALRKCNWLLREPGSGTREAVEHALLPHLHEFQSSLEIGSAEAIKNAASEGLGLACLSHLVARDFVQLRRLVILRTTLPPLRRNLSLVLHRHKFISPAMQAFIAHAKAHGAR